MVVGRGRGGLRPFATTIPARGIIHDVYGDRMSIVLNGETIAPVESERVERVFEDGESLIVVHVHRALIVQCGVCSAKFPGYDAESTTQASGCAAVYVDGKIEGFYGSRIADMTMFDVAESLRAELAPRIDPVCDDCIQRWLDAGLARELGEVRYGYRPEDPAVVVPHRRGEA